MQEFVINGGHQLYGEIKLQGAKNSILPVLSACVLADGDIRLENCPDLSDVYASGRILNSLGCRASFNSHGSMDICCSSIERTEISESLMQQMRSSITFLGAVLGKCGECRLSFPGGCQLGPRPVDMHLSALRQMGAEISEEHGVINCRASGGLKGTRIILQFPSVGATENIILAAVLAKGETELRNAAREPEVSDLICFLKKCGAEIECSGDSTVRIRGVDKLNGCRYRIMPDRIAAATYMAAAVMTGGVVHLTGTEGIDISAFSEYFEQMGCSLNIYKDSVFIRASGKLKAVKTFKTLPYPGFPTDMQAIFMSAMSISEGTSVFEENIFESRYKHVDALNRMGADIRVFGKIAVVRGTEKLSGANSHAPDLRGGAAIVLAALAAEGRSVIHDIGHIDRGYEKMDKVLASVGADIKRK